jgi:multidrug efflux pump subunit AcrA (membrane-fusion protein)
MAESEVKEEVGKLDMAPPDNVASRKGSLKRWLTALFILGIVAGILVFQIRSRISSEQALRAVTAQMAVPSVSVVQPKPTAPAEEIILPGNIQPFVSSPIYARTDGYLKKWYFDIGAHVKAGQLLAVIETPEVDQQLAQARSTLPPRRQTWTWLVSPMIVIRDC